MRTKLLAAVVVFLAGCLESNPQPSPENQQDSFRQDEDVAVSEQDSSFPVGLDALGESDEVQEKDTTSFVDLYPEFCPDDFCPASDAAAPDPSVEGPYPVGVRTFELELLDHLKHPRTIKVEVWYPTTEEFRNGPFESIDLTADAPEDLQEMVSQYRGQLPLIPVNVVRDAPIRGDAGPYPLVVFSHGAYGIRFQSVFFTVPLASHGYVVAAPDHTGNVLYDLFRGEGYNMDDMILSAYDRPLDVTRVLDEMLEASGDPSDFFYGTVDPERIGLSGHSFGGYTSLNLGFTDSRVKVVVPMAPATTPLGLLGFDLTQFPLPMMMMTGAMDKTLNTPTEMREPFELFPSPKAYFELKTGGHFTYSDICVLDLKFIAHDLGIQDADNALDDGCADWNIPTEEAHPLIDQFAIGYFNYWLRGSTDSEMYFDQNAGDAVSEILDYRYTP